MELYLSLKKYLTSDVTTIIMALLIELVNDETNRLMMTIVSHRFEVIYNDNLYNRTDRFGWHHPKYGQRVSIRYYMRENRFKFLFSAHQGRTLRKIMISQYHYDGPVNMIVNQIDINGGKCFLFTKDEISGLRYLWKQDLRDKLIGANRSPSTIERFPPKQDLETKKIIGGYVQRMYDPFCISPVDL